MNPQGKSRVRFQERAELLDFLLEVSAITSETLDLDRLLENVADIVRRVIPHELFAILLYNEKRRGLKIRYAVGHRQELVQNLIVPLGEGVTGVAARDRKPVVVADVRDEHNYLNAMDAVRSELAVPMVVRHKLVGVIDLQSTTLTPFRDRNGHCCNSSRAVSGRPSTTRASIAAWTGRTGSSARSRCWPRSSVPSCNWIRCSTKSQSPCGR
jgi:sigma-B regulation protein RsbU (phosphoserine phosphatase)